MPGRFLTGQWRHLLMINYEIDPAILRPLMPAGTELDLWQGKCLVSMVGFLFLRTRVLGMPIPFHRNFEEISLRFYVLRRERSESRRGVVFVREIVPRRAIAAVARWAYNEPYVACPMRSKIDLPISNTIGSVEYGWQATNGWNTLAARIAGEPSVLKEGSDEQFITEHYWGYTAQRDGSTIEYRVEHPPWRVWRATEPTFTCDVAGFYGRQFAPALSSTPSSTFVAEGSQVAVYQPRRVE